MADPEVNGVVPDAPRGLREIAEDAYDAVVDTADADDAAESEPDSTERPRDERGRWVAKTPQAGEAEAETPPSPVEVTQEQEEHPAPETGQAAQAPANWSAEDRANFEKLPPEGQQFLLRRHSEMEGDYQKRVQATVSSNQFVNAVVPVFNDPEIAQSMANLRFGPAEMVYQWAGFHKRALSENPNHRIDLLFELADRMQLDPAMVFSRIQTAPPSLSFSPEELSNPALKKFADHIGHLTHQLKAQSSQLERIRTQEQEALLNARRSEVNAFGDAKNPDGSPAHPQFDVLLPIIAQVYQADNRRSIEDCYRQVHQAVYGPVLKQAQAAVEQKQNLARAQTAVRSNVRGMTAPVSRPAPPEGNRGLRATMEEAAQEIGFDG